jgi:diphthine-ammonia ligase
VLHAACAPALTRRSQQLGLEYAPAPGDEVEDLRALLAAAKAAVPDLGGVCSGAILSDYQRLRVEAVASSLGLASLAYLWRRNQASLLAEMAAAPLHAVLVKVAALGLSPARHLGRRLDALTPHLVALERRYGCHAAGEGGEYETLTLDCPAFRCGRLVIDESVTVEEGGASGGGADVGHLRVAAWHVERKAEGADAGAADVREVAGDAPPPPPPLPPPPADGDIAPRCCVAVTRGAAAWTYAARALEPNAEDAPGDAACEEAAAAAALRAQLQSLAAAMRADGLAWHDALHVSLYLRDMSHFGACNAAYISVVPIAAPPARACVAAPLAHSARCAVDVAVRSPAAAAAGVPRAAMHVQSISCWAPACIGPYAQATRCGGLVFLAGQLGLDPPTMALARGACGSGSANDAAEAAAAVAAAVAVAEALRAPLRAATAAATLFATSDGAAASLAAAWADLLAGRVLPRPGFGPDGAAEPDSADDGSGNADGGAALRAWPWRWQPLLTAVRMRALPRGAAVELQPLALAPDCAWGGDQEWDAGSGCAAAAAAADGDVAAMWVPRRFVRAHAGCDAGADAAAAAVAGAAALAGALARAQLTWRDVFCLRVYHVVTDDAAGDTAAAALCAAWVAALASHCAVSVAPLLVPVLGVASAGGPPLAALAELTAWRPAQLDADE